jgi:hypothetical protein
MPVKLEAEEIDKSFTSNIRMVESYRTASGSIDASISP